MPLTTVRKKGGGEIQVPETHLVTIRDGLFGFDGKERFAVLPQADSAESPFLWLQSLDDAELAFLCLDPRFFRPGYLPRLSRDDWETLETKPEEAILLTLVVVPEDPREMTANLLGPIVISPATRRGRQVVSQDPSHGVRHRILEELQTLRNASPQGGSAGC